MRHFLAAKLGLCGAIISAATAGEAVYVTYGTDGTPSYSSQAYDSSYVPYRQDAAPTVRAKRPSPPARLQKTRAQAIPLIRQIAEEQGIDPVLVTAVVEVESGFNFNATSPKGAIGAMQLLPRTAASYGATDVRDPQQNLAAGIRYLKDLLAAYNGNLPLALAAYNSGQGNIQRHHQRIPPFSETMLYVPQVLAKMEAYQRLREADAP